MNDGSIGTGHQRGNRVEVSREEMFRWMHNAPWTMTERDRAFGLVQWLERDQGEDLVYYRTSIDKPTDQTRTIARRRGPDVADAEKLLNVNRNSLHGSVARFGGAAPQPVADVAQITSDGSWLVPHTRWVAHNRGRATGSGPMSPADAVATCRCGMVLTPTGVCSGGC